MQNQALGLPSVRLVGHPGFREMHLDECTEILALTPSLFLKQIASLELVVGGQ